MAHKSKSREGSELIRGSNPAKVCGVAARRGRCKETARILPQWPEPHVKREFLCGLRRLLRTGELLLPTATCLFVARFPVPAAVPAPPRRPYQWHLPLQVSHSRRPIAKAGGPCVKARIFNRRQRLPSYSLPQSLRPCQPRRATTGSGMLYGPRLLAAVRSRRVQSSRGCLPSANGGEMDLVPIEEPIPVQSHPAAQPFRQASRAETPATSPPQATRRFVTLDDSGCRAARD